MKRILTFFFACFYFLCASAQEQIHYSSFQTDDAPTDYSATAPLMPGLKGSLKGPVTVESVIAGKCAVTSTQYFTKSAEVCNKLNWASEVITDGSEIIPGNVRWWWENGFDAYVTLDWAINSGLWKGSIRPYLELKAHRLNNQLSRCYRFPDGSVLVMLKVGKSACANMFLRLLRAFPKQKTEEPKTEVPIKLGTEETKVTLGSTYTPPAPLALSIKKQETNETKYDVVKYQGCCGGGVVLIRGRNTTPKPVVVGGGNPGGGSGNTGGGNPGGSGTVGGGNPGGG